MASAAAVAADASKPIIRLDEEPRDDIPFSTAVTSVESPVPGDEDEEEQAPQTVPNGAGDGEDEDDLFGDEGDEEEPPKKPIRQLDDEDLDSGDDDGRADRVAADEEAPDEAEEDQDFNYIDVSVARHGIPEPSDNELYLLRVPNFLGLEPNEWKQEGFKAPESSHRSEEASDSFSAFDTALSTLRWRHAPSNPSEIQSNARILRWSDGSLTLQFASEPTTQYTIEGKPLAPPQKHPLKPTPVSNKRIKASDVYDPTKDSFTYLGAPCDAQGMIRITNKITAGLSILPTASKTDDALERLQAGLAKGRAGTSDLEIINIDEDPENLKRRAEAAEKEKAKAARKREAAELRDRERADRTLQRGGLRTGGGLTIGGLEDDEGTGMRRANRPKTQRRQRRDDYSDEEDFGRGKKTKEDEYDEEDDFIAGSDEEIGEEGEEEEEEELDDEDAEGEPDDEPPARARAQESPKRSRPELAAADEDDTGQAAARSKRRRVVEEDDDDE